MKKLTVSKTSWHYELAKLGAGDRRVPDNLCPYLRKVMIGFLIVAFIFVVAFIITCSYGDVLAWLVAGIVHGFVMPNPFTTIAFVVTGLITIASIGFGIHVLRTKYPVTGDKPKRVTFIGLLYRKFKDKTCVELDFD